MNSAWIHFNESIQTGMSGAGWLNYNSLGIVKMKADFSFENKYQKKMSVASSPLQKISKKWTLIVEAYSEKKNHYK